MQEAYRLPHSHRKCLLFRGGSVPGVPPLPGPGMGYPPTWTWDGVTPLPRTEMRYPSSDRARVPPIRQDRGTPPLDRTGGTPVRQDRGNPRRTGPGYPPCGQTHRQVSKHYLPVVLRTRAVTIIEILIGHYKDFHTYKCFLISILECSSNSSLISNQWQIQNFPDGGHQPPRWECQPIIWPVCSEDCMKMKEIGQREESLVLQLYTRLFLRVSNDEIRFAI